EERLDLVDLDAASGQDARQQFRYIVPLGNGERSRRRPLVEPVAPGPAANRAFDAEEQPCRCLRRQRQSSRHENSVPIRDRSGAWHGVATDTRPRAAVSPQFTALKTPCGTG